MVVKSDQESVLRSIVEHVGRFKSHRWEWSIRHSSFRPERARANGIMEGAIHSVFGQVRVLLSALEERCGRVIPYDHPMIVTSSS